MIWFNYNSAIPGRTGCDHNQSHYSGVPWTIPLYVAKISQYILSFIIEYKVLRKISYRGIRSKRVFWSGLLKPKFVAHYYKTISLFQFVMCNRMRFDHEFFENLLSLDPVLTWTCTKACCLPTDDSFVSFICVIPTPCRRHKVDTKS